MISSYAPKRNYRLNKLDDVIYLLPFNVNQIRIDDGEAYIEWNEVGPTPTKILCKNVTLTEEETLDERYEFSHQVTFQINGYVNHNDFLNKYYVIVKDKENNYWLLNPEFPSKVSYVYNLANNINRTEFTLQTISNHPVLYIKNIDEVLHHESLFECKGYQVSLPSFNALRLNEKIFSLKNDNAVYYTNDGYKDIEYNDNTLAFEETYDGDMVSHQITFTISFDGYKPSWQYNLLEFENNLYTAIIKTLDGHFILSGFETGYKPYYNINANESNNIEIRLIDGYNNGKLLSYQDALTLREIEEKQYRYTAKYDGYECKGKNIAIFLLQEEIDAFGNKTGNYRCKEGYEDRFTNLNIVGTFDDEQEFVNPNCSGEQCKLITNLNNISFNDTSSKTFTLFCSDSWRITSSANYITVSPSQGNGGEEYNITVKNSRTPSQSLITSLLTVEYCDEQQKYEVYLQSKNCIIDDVYNISADGQYVTIATQCPVKSATNETLTNITLTNAGVKVYVPENINGTNKSYIINITFQDGSHGTATINQTSYYERWIADGYVCEGGKKYEILYQYTGTTSSAINIRTGKTKRGNQIPDAQGDCDTSSRLLRWLVSEQHICIDGLKYEVMYEQESYDGGETWDDTGATRRGKQVPDEEGECAESSSIKLMPNSEVALIGCDDKMNVNFSYYIINPNDLSIPPVTASSTGYYVRFKGDTETNWKNMSYESPTTYENSAYTQDYSTQDNPIQYFDVQLMDAAEGNILDRRIVNASYNACAVLEITDKIVARVQGSIDALSGEVSSHTNSISTIEQTLSSITSTVERHTTYIEGNEVWKESASTRIQQTADAITQEASARLSGDTQLDSRITQTASAITQEVSARTAADNALNSKIEQTASSITADLRSLSGNVDNMREDITTISATTTGITSTVRSLSGQVSANTSSISQLQQTASSITADLRTVSGDVNTNKTNIAAISATTTGITSTVRDLESTVSGNSESISQLQQTATAITSTVSTLQNTVDNFSVGGRNKIMNGAALQPVENGVPMYWTKWGNPTIWNVYTDASGKKWLHLRPSSGSNWQGYKQTHWHDHKITINPDETYTLSFIAYASANTTRQQAVLHFMKEGEYVYSGASIVQYNMYFNLTTTPTKYKFTFIPRKVAQPSGYTGIIDSFEFLIGQGQPDSPQKDLYFTDIMLEQSNAPSNWVPSVEEQEQSIVNVRSEIQQTATSITASIYDELNERTGIDVRAGEITLDAENTYINGNLNLYDASGNGLTIYDADGYQRVNIQSDSIGQITQLSGDTYDRKSAGVTVLRSNFSGTSAVTTSFSVSAGKSMDLSNFVFVHYATPTGTTGTTVFPTPTNISFRMELMSGSTASTPFFTQDISVTKIDSLGSYRWSNGMLKYELKNATTFYARFTSLYNKTLSPAMNVVLSVGFNIGTADRDQTYIGKDGMYVHAGTNKLLWVDDTQVQMRYDFGGLRIINNTDGNATGGTLQTIAGFYGYAPNRKPVWVPFHNYEPLFRPSYYERQYISNTRETKYVYRIDPINDVGMCFIEDPAFDDSGNKQETWILLPPSTFTYEGTNVNLPTGYKVIIINNTLGNFQANVYVTPYVTSYQTGIIYDGNRDKNYYVGINDTVTSSTFIYTGYNGVWRQLEDSQ